MRNGGGDERDCSVVLFYAVLCSAVECCAVLCTALPSRLSSADRSLDILKHYRIHRIKVNCRVLREASEPALLAFECLSMLFVFDSVVDAVLWGLAKHRQSTARALSDLLCATVGPINAIYHVIRMQMLITSTGRSSAAESSAGPLMPMRATNGHHLSTVWTTIAMPFVMQLSVIMK